MLDPKNIGSDPGVGRVETRPIEEDAQFTRLPLFFEGEG